MAGSAMKAKTGATVQLDGSASSDADGDTLIYSWTLFSAPAGSIATLNNASSAKPSFTADVAGTYVASLVVNDGKIGSAASKVEIKVDAVAFNSIPSAFPPNMPSWGFQAKQTASLGDRIELAAATPRKLSEITIAMSSWACGNGAGDATCATTPGATYDHPITIRFFADNGTPLGELTKTFAIPFRPSTTASCGDWRWKAEDGICYNGYGFKITFDMRDVGVTLPETFSYELAFNTQSYGAQPTGVANAPYNSLNVGLYSNTALPSVGRDLDITLLRKNSAEVSSGSSGVMAQIITTP